MPTGRLMYEIEEDVGYVEVCLTLVNEAVLRTSVNVTLTPVPTNSTIFARGELDSFRVLSCTINLLLCGCFVAQLSLS